MTGPAERGPGHHTLGRARGGLTTEIHFAADGNCRPLCFVLTPRSPEPSPGIGWGEVDTWGGDRVTCDLHHIHPLAAPTGLIATRSACLMSSHAAPRCLRSITAHQRAWATEPFRGPAEYD